MKNKNKIGQSYSSACTEYFSLIFFQYTQELFTLILVVVLLVILQIGLRSNSARLESRVVDRTPVISETLGTFYTVPVHIER